MTLLQKEYNLIKEGKGNKAHFLKLTRLTFPEHVDVHNTYEQTVSILSNKSLLSEGVGGIVTINNKKPNWFKIFEAEVKADMKETDKEVVDMETRGFDYKDEKNIDNLYGQAFLLGYIAEMDDPKNADKTVAQVKEMVAKNMAKDRNYYFKEAMFSVKGIKGEQLDTPKEVKGKFAASGMEPVKIKESKYSLVELLGEKEEMYEEDAIDEGAMDDQIAAAEKEVAQKKKEAADAEKKAADIKAQEAAAEANA